MTKKVVGVALVAGLLMIGAAAKCEAAFIAYICDTAACTGTQGVNWYATADGGNQGAIVGDGLANGSVVLVVNLGGLSVLINSSQSKPMIGSAASPVMDLLFSATGIGTVWYYASDTDFVGTNVGLTGILSANSVGGSAATVNACIYGLGDNAQKSLINASCTGDLAAGIGGLNVGLNHVASTVSPFSITLGLKMTRTDNGAVTGDYGVQAVPEPGSMMLLGTGLLGLAAVARRGFAK